MDVYVLLGRWTYVPHSVGIGWFLGRKNHAASDADGHDRALGFQIAKARRASLRINIDMQKYRFREGPSSCRLTPQITPHITPRITR